MTQQQQQTRIAKVRSECTTACETGSERTWVETQAQSGNGAACPTTAADCADGDGTCTTTSTGTTTDTDCAGSWSACTADCETASERTWTETAAQSGNGAACPDATDCANGDGECVVAVDADCEGSWSACTAACETASERTCTETTAQSGNGAACPDATDCAGGDGECVADGTDTDTDDTTEEPTTTTGSSDADTLGSSSSALSLFGAVLLFLLH